MLFFYCIHLHTVKLLFYCDLTKKNEQSCQTKSHCGQILLLFYPFEPVVSINTAERVFALSSLFRGFLALNSRKHCQMGKRLHRQKERPNSIRKWQLFSCARGARQLPGVVAKVTGSPASWCKWAAVRFDGGDVGG